jgi:pimeloyl-ACP methyl ester carboxylesterase
VAVPALASRWSGRGETVRTRYTSVVLGLLTLLAVALALLLAIFTGVLTYEMRHPPRRSAGYALARGLHVDPESAGLRFREWSIESNGATLPVWDIATQQATGAAAVFVHGWGQSRIDMLARIAPWPDLVSRIIMFDLRGHGDASPAPGTSNLGVNESQDLLEVLRAIDDGPIVLVGYSMGAVIAIETAAMESPLRERIEGVVAFGPYDDFNTSLRGRLTVAGYPTRPITDFALFLLRFAGLRHRPLTPSAARLQCPLLVMHGERDRVVPIAHGKRLAEAAPQGTLRSIANGAHLDLHLADPEAVNDAIVKFVEQINVRKNGDRCDRRDSRDATASPVSAQQSSSAN